MKKYIFIAAVLCMSINGYAQKNDQVKIEKKGELTEATYFYSDGSVQQQGTFNAAGELHGVWTSYDINGEKLAVGSYENGKKVGKWFFWTESSLKEVDYIDSRVASVYEWKDKTQVAIRNK